jgi:ubiquinone biosynthesis protein
MGRLLTYLFEVTERFGMQTRTELILLQRTMVVVEGVARSLNPSINIWTVAKPVVEGYISSHVGPRAAARDLLKTARVLSRFGPKLPGLVEAALVAQANPSDQASGGDGIWARFGWAAGGASAALIAVGLFQVLG